MRLATMWKLLTKPHARSAANSSMRVSRNTSNIVASICSTACAACSGSGMSSFSASLTMESFAISLASMNAP